MPDFSSGKRYYTYDAYLKKTFGQKCLKIALDGGFTCPNRDGRAGFGGCAFCGGGGAENPLGSRGRPTPSDGGARSFASPAPPLPLRLQYEKGREALSKKWGEHPAIVSFSSYTSTYAPVSVLRALYDEALSFPDVVGLTVSTRPDALPPDVLDLLSGYAARTVLTVELGLQTVCDEVARRLNRGYPYCVFLEAFSALRARGIRVCVHLIDGLPGEGREEMLASARALAALAPDGVKFHELYLRRGAALADAWLSKPFPLLSREEYVEILASQIELLPPTTVVERITGDPLRSDAVAPLWALDKKKTSALLDKTLAKRRSFQGICYNCTN